MGLAHLKGLTSLSRLSLVNTSVSDAGLVHLSALSEFCELELGPGPRSVPRRRQNWRRVRRRIWGLSSNGYWRRPRGQTRLMANFWASSSTFPGHSRGESAGVRLGRGSAGSARSAGSR